MFSAQQHSSMWSQNTWSWILWKFQGAKFPTLLSILNSNTTHCWALRASVAFSYAFKCVYFMGKMTILLTCTAKCFVQEAKRQQFILQVLLIWGMTLSGKGKPLLYLLTKIWNVGGQLHIRTTFYINNILLHILLHQWLEKILFDVSKHWKS